MSSSISIGEAIVSIRVRLVSIAWDILMSGGGVEYSDSGPSVPKISPLTPVSGVLEADTAA